MLEAVQRAVARIAERHGVEAERVADGLEIVLAGSAERLTVLVHEDACLCRADEWHVHLHDADALADFLNRLFAGDVQIVVKYRGETPVAHQVQVTEAGRVRVVSQTRLLITPFWRRKSFRTLRYEHGIKSVETHPPQGRA